MGLQECLIIIIPEIRRLLYSMGPEPNADCIGFLFRNRDGAQSGTAPGGMCRGASALTHRVSEQPCSARAGAR